ncbi:uncharacterized protein PRCAT00000578001 [Priceomyces carsonii]|uniref:uncharacterized protein n=1 Tax=Priceomyces carsonii TaxID=28549 RepID=UPI002ED9414B|nr:unnamed protein product [Priceomyces carsonii]
MYEDFGRNPLQPTLQTKRITQELPPSDPNFDRSKVTDDEFIERLLFENRELQDSLRQYKREVEALEETIRGFKVLALISKHNGDSSSTKGPHASNTSIDDTADTTIVNESNIVPKLKDIDELSSAITTEISDVPQRSARRRASLRVELPGLDAVSGRPSSPLEKKMTGSDSVINHMSKRSPEKSESTNPFSNRSSVYSDEERLVLKSRPSSKPDFLGIAAENKSESVEDEIDRIKEPVNLPKEPLSTSELVAEESEEPDKTQRTKQPAILPKRSINTSESVVEEAEGTDNIKQSAILPKKPINTSFSAYKSRIRLPSSMQQQLPSKDGSFASSRDSINKTLSPSKESGESSAFVNNSLNSVTNLTLDPHTQTSDNIDMDKTFSSSRFNNGNISNDKLSTSLDEDPGSQVSSPGVNSKQYFTSVLNKSDFESEVLRTPISANFTSTDSLGFSKSNSSFQVLQSPRPEEDDTPLFIKPEEFQTIEIVVVSTIHFPVSSSSSKDPNCTISINDRKSSKEMWRIRKSYSQLVAFDNEIRPYVEYFGLPPIPDKSLFLSSSPSKVDTRRIGLQNYFNTIFLMPHIPHMVLFRICRYLSLNIVNPLDDYKSGSRKEGFLIRRYKGLGSSWKIRWCQVDGPFLQIFEGPGGQLLEQIKLKGTQIGKQSGDAVADDRGYRHAFLVMEQQKSKLSSTVQKYFFCAESDQERDEWIDSLFEFNNLSDGSFEGDASSLTIETNRGRTDEDSETQSYSQNIPTPHRSRPQQNENTLSTYEEDIKEQKELKKLRKRSIFPFRKTNNNNNPSDNNDEASNVPSLNANDLSVQSYLDLLNLDENLTKTIFGRDIHEVFKLSNKTFYGKSIPSICFRCLDFLTRTGAIYEEGIFRLSGSASIIRQLKEQFNTKFDLDLFESSLKPDIHTVSGLLKTYLRELPSPIIGTQCLSDLNNIAINSAAYLSHYAIAIKFKEYFNDDSKVDKISYNLSYVIFKFLRQIIAKNQSNRMNMRNVCIVFVPTLNVSLEVLNTFLVDFNCIFEGGIPTPDEDREVLDLHIPTF